MDFDSWSAPMQVMFLMGAMVGGMFVFFLPALVASRRKHSNMRVILLLMCLGNWFLLPWCYALWMAFQEDNRGNLSDDELWQVRDYRRRRLAQLQPEDRGLRIDPMKIRQQELQDQATRYLR